MRCQDFEAESERFVSITDFVFQNLEFLPPRVLLTGNHHTVQIDRSQVWINGFEVRDEPAYL